jgi:hypothetical protein
VSHLITVPRLGTWSVTVNHRFQHGPTVVTAQQKKGSPRFTIRNFEVSQLITVSARTNRGDCTAKKRVHHDFTIRNLEVSQWPTDSRSGTLKCHSWSRFQHGSTVVSVQKKRGPYNFTIRNFEVSQLITVSSTDQPWWGHSRKGVHHDFTIRTFEVSQLITVSARTNRGDCTATKRFTTFSRFWTLKCHGKSQSTIKKLGSQLITVSARTNRGDCTATKGSTTISRLGTLKCHSESQFHDYELWSVTVNHSFSTDQPWYCTARKGFTTISRSGTLKSHS